jgi:hypothetical protein
MIDPRISLLARVPDLGQTFNNIQNRLNNREAQQQNTQLFDMQMAQGQQQMQDDRDNRRLRSVAEFSTTDILPNIGNPQLLASKLQQRIVMMDNDPNMDSTESREALAQLQSGDLAGLQRDAQASIQLFNMRNGISPKAQEGFTLNQGQQRFDAAGNVVASVAPKPEASAVTKTPIPQILLEGLTPNVANKGAAAYLAAGSGKDGLTAFTRVVDNATEQERRIASPKLLKQSFPQATPAESRQLQASMDAARNTEQGLADAGKVRSEQRRLKKAKVFQDRAVKLIDRVLGNSELGDVLGSVEGAFDFRLQDSESELISDIEEAGNILTADNLSLMSGVLSETDIKIIANLAGGALNRKRSEARFRKDAGILRDKLSSQQVLTVDDLEEQQLSAPQTKTQFTEGQTATDSNGQKIKFTNGNWVAL